MVVILYSRGCLAVVKKAAADLLHTFARHVEVRLISASSSSSWPFEPSWDDLLVVFYSGKPFPLSGNSLIREYLAKRPLGGNLLPVALDLNAQKPPEAASAIKALPHDASRDSSRRLVNRIGAMLGLRIQGRDSKIFISYRASDGARIAKQLHAHLTSLGHNPFLDQAKEIDGQTKILPGSPVQKEINEALDGANWVLLIDTPAAPDSPWIKHEIETADAVLLPILPICFRDQSDTKRGPRFRSLLALQRWVQLETPRSINNPLSADQLTKIVTEAENYLCEIFRRKCRVPFIVEKEFVSQGFAWSVLDKRLLMFQSSKGTSWRVKTNVLSHCSIFDQVYTPAMKRFRDFLKQADRCSYSLFIYDGELLPESELREIAQGELAIILHHQELAALIKSNFTTLAA